MNEKINQPRALSAANDIVEALIALKYDQRHAFIHREDIEHAMISLGKELGVAVITAGSLEAAE